MEYADKYLSGTPEEVIEATKKEGERIRKLLQSSCAPDLYEALDEALDKHIADSITVLEELVRLQNLGKS